MAEYDFFKHGSPPRETSFWRHCLAVAAVVFGHGPWAFNVLRLYLVQVVALLVPGAALILLGVLLPSLCSALHMPYDTPSDFLALFANEFANQPISQFLLTFQNYDQLMRSLLVLASLYLTARILQRWFDFRAWHTPWAPAHADRACARWNFPGAKDFPCMIVGVGGSGKSTLAEILERSYVDRQLIKLRNANEIGEERTRISRDMGETGIGGAQQAYTITWAPGRFKVGRMAEAYDLPGQIVEDWSSAFHQMTGEGASRPRRIAIFHVVSNGYNANIRKFKPVAAECAPGKFICMIEKGEIPIERDPKNICEYKVKDGYRTEYLKYYRDREIEKFNEFLKAVSANLKGNKETQTKPLEILLVHVIGMASHWAEFERVAAREQDDDGEESVRLASSSCDARNCYAKKFCDIQKQLSAIPNVSLTVGYLPASLQFDDMKVEYEGQPITVFELANRQKRNYEEKSRYRVMVHSALALATVKTVRALRLALHAKPKRWFHHEIKTKEPEHDLFDRWTACPTDSSKTC